MAFSLAKTPLIRASAGAAARSFISSAPSSPFSLLSRNTSPSLLSRGSSLSFSPVVPQQYQPAATFVSFPLRSPLGLTRDGNRRRRQLNDLDFFNDPFFNDVFDDFTLAPVLPMRDIFDLSLPAVTRGGNLPSGGGRQRWAPRADVHETDKAIQVQCDLPGVNEKDVKVTVDGDLLTIQGQRSHEKEDKGGEGERQWQSVERSFGFFRRSFRLPYELKPDQVKANFERGVLSITIPKEGEKLPRSFEVKLGSGSGSSEKLEAGNVQEGSESGSASGEKAAESGSSKPGEESKGSEKSGEKKSWKW